MPTYRRRRRRDSPPVDLDVNGALAEIVGPNGLSADDRSALAVALEPARRRLADAAPGFLDFPRRRAELLEVQTLTNGLLGRFETLVVFGAGASAVGARVLGTVRPTGRIRRPRLVVADSIDPQGMADLLLGLDLRRTLFNVVSQSGDAAETMAQFVIVRDRLLRELGAVDYREHVVVTTDPERGSLRQIVNDEGFHALPIPDDVQGAFGLLTAVGLFPAAMTGVDVEQVLDGAAMMSERCDTRPTADQDPAALLAGVLWSLATLHGARGLAIVPYGAALAGFAEWGSQLWTDSVGTIRHTELVRHYEAGGFSGRVLLLLRMRAYAGELQVPVAYQDLSDVGYLGGHGLADILTAEGDAAGFLLARHGRPSVEVGVPTLTPAALGQLIHLFQRASAMLAALEGRAPGQIADADEARRVLGSLLGRSGTVVEAGDLAAWRARKDLRYIL